MVPARRRGQSCHEGFGLGPGVVRTPSLIYSFVIVTATRGSLVNHRRCFTPTLTEECAPLAFWHIVQLSRSPQLRDLMSVESGR